MSSVSVVDAVRCAIEVQNGLLERNAGVPEDRRIRFRVGIHVGDVVEESDGDLMGDGVNVAARLEGVAKPGAICLSEDAYRQVKQRLDLKVSDLGATRLKNIADPVRVYSVEVSVPGAPGPAAAEKSLQRKPQGLLKRWRAIAAALAVVALAVGAYAWRSGVASQLIGTSSAAPHLSIVVLPFANLNGDPAQDYFADAITDDLTTDLSHIQDSFVIARNTAFTYKGKAIDAKEIGRELGVRYVLEGSVRRSGDEIAINAQLISTETGAHVWADRFEGERASLGGLQVDVVARLSNALGVALLRAESLRATHAGSRNPDAIDLAMRGLAAHFQFSPDSNKEAVALYEEALKLDPGLVRALNGLAGALSDRVVFGWSKDPKEDMQRAEQLADQALTA